MNANNIALVVKDVHYDSLSGDLLCLFNILTSATVLMYLLPNYI